MMDPSLTQSHTYINRQPSYPMLQLHTLSYVLQAAVCCCFCVGLLLSLRTLKQHAMLDTMHRLEIRHGGSKFSMFDEGSTGHASPLEERESILKRAEAWNKVAQTAGLPTIDIVASQPGTSDESDSKDPEHETGKKDEEHERQEEEEEQREHGVVSVQAQDD